MLFRSYNGEPIWNTAARQGKKVATILWPTSDVEINGALPYMYKSTLTDNGLTSEQRIDTALKWMAMDEALRPDLLMLFLEGPEQTIRKYGQDSEEAKKSIENADAMIARLREGIKKLPDSKRINLIVTSDHGMTKVDKECFFNINDYIKPEWYEKRVGNNPMHIFTKPQFTDSVYNSLRRVYKVYVWKKDGVPDDLKFFNETGNFGDILDRKSVV